MLFVLLWLHQIVAQTVAHGARDAPAVRVAMSNADSSPLTGAVEAAIARVLAAERSARDAVALSREAAEAMTEATRAAARALHERTERRIRALHAAFEHRASTELAALEAEAAGLVKHDELSTDEQARVERSVAALAAELTRGAR